MVRINLPKPSAIAWLNSALIPIDQATVPVLDRGFLFGDGVYEVMPVYSGTPFLLDKHLRRLQRSLDAIQIKNPYDNAGWSKLFSELLAANSAEHVSIYLQITRGTTVNRDHVFPADPVAPTVFVMCAPLPEINPAIIKNGVSAILREDSRWSRCDIKSTSLLANVLLRQEAAAAGAAETLLHRGGILTEGSASSVFAVIDDAIVSPDDGPEILPGTTRDLVMELLNQAGMPAQFQAIPVASLSRAEEIWICSSIREVVAVTRLDNKTVGNGKPGPVFHRIRELFSDYKINGNGAGA